MKHILVSLDTEEITTLEKTGDKNVIAKVKQFIVICEQFLFGLTFTLP